MNTQSEAMLEEELIDKLVKMDYERVNIKNEDELYANFKRQLEKLNAKELKRFGRDTFQLLLLESTLSTIADFSDFNFSMADICISIRLSNNERKSAILRCSKNDGTRTFKPFRSLACK